MPLRLVNLGSLQIASNTTKQSLYIACSLTLDLPAFIYEHIDATALTEMTKSGRLWIAKADTCRLEVVPSVQGVEVAGGKTDALRRVMVDAVGRCSIWEDLSLKLREERRKVLNDDEDLDAYTLFIINHPDLSSQFLSPANIPCAQLLTLTCDVCYGTKPTSKAAPKRTKRRRKKNRKRTKLQASNGFGDNGRTPIGFYNEDTTTEDEDEEDDEEEERAQPRIRITVKGKPQASRAASESQETHRTQQNTVSTLESEAIRKDTALLLKAGLSNVLGLKTPVRGTRVVRDLSSPPLIDIAPAVFNIRYLQAFASRAEHIPYIASCLAGIDAESPSLRAKLRALTRGDQDVDPAAELEIRIHMLVQRGLDVPPVAPGKRSRGRAATVEESRQAEGRSQVFGEESQLLDQASQILDESQLDEEMSQLPDGLSQPDVVSQQHEDLSQQPDSVQEHFDWFDEDLESKLHDTGDNFDLPQPPERAVRQDSIQPWREEESDPTDDSQQQQRQREVRYDAIPDNGDVPGHSGQYVQEPGQEWLDLSQARYILDENGERLPISSLEDLPVHGDYEYELVPLSSDGPQPQPQEVFGAEDPAEPPNPWGQQPSSFPQQPRSQEEAGDGNWQSMA